jgi:O-antigen/teichoic acid export membrane protein
MFKFLKNFGIYGIIPILNKFIGFLLVPIYTRTFSTEEFGIVEMYRSVAMFAVFFISMEIYTAVGRYFYDYDNNKDRSVLVSTGLWFNVITAVMVISVLLLFHNTFYQMLFNNTDSYSTYYIVLLWIPLQAIYSYFSVMMRFEKKPKLFLYITISQLLFRTLTIIILVIVLKIGINGIFLGNIIGEIFGITCLIILLKKYLTFSFNKKILIKLLLFALPLVPGLLIFGMQRPWANYIIQKNLTYSDLGLFSLGLKVVSVLTIINYGLKMAWRPYLYEQIAKGNYGSDIRKIFNFFLIILGFSSLFISLFSKEIIFIISTQEYYKAYVIVGFLSISVSFEILVQIIGIGPEITKKTYWKIIINVIGVIVTICSLYLLIGNLGLISIPIAFLIGNIVKFAISWLITVKMTSLKFSTVPIILISSALIAINIVILYYHFFIWQKILFMIIMFIIMIYRYRNVIKLSYNKLSTIFVK